MAFFSQQADRGFFEGVMVEVVMEVVAEVFWGQGSGHNCNGLLPPKRQQPLLRRDAERGDDTRHSRSRHRLPLHGSMRSRWTCSFRLVLTAGVPPRAVIGLGAALPELLRTHLALDVSLGEGLSREVLAA